MADNSTLGFLQFDYEDGSSLPSLPRSTLLSPLQDWFNDPQDVCRLKDNFPPEKEAHIRNHPDTLIAVSYQYKRLTEATAYAAGMMLAHRNNDGYLREIPLAPGTYQVDHPHVWCTDFWRGVCDQRAQTLVVRDRHNSKGTTGEEEPFFKIDRVNPMLLSHLVAALIVFDEQAIRREGHIDPEPWSDEEIWRMRKMARKGYLTLVGDSAQKLVFLLYGPVMRWVDLPDGVFVFQSNLEVAKQILRWTSYARRRGWVRAAGSWEIIDDKRVWVEGKEFPFSERRKGRPPTDSYLWMRMPEKSTAPKEEG